MILRTHMIAGNTRTTAANLLWLHLPIFRPLPTRHPDVSVKETQTSVTDITVVVAVKDFHFH